MSFIPLITYFLNEDTKSIWLALQNALILSLLFQNWIYWIPQQEPLTVVFSSYW